jgi:Predicted transcriptional regulators
MNVEKKKKLKKFGVLISQERKNKDFSLRDFAKEVGVSHVAISHIEKGKVEAKKETLIKIAKILNYDKDTLLAKASKLDDDVENMLSEKSETAAVLFRSAAGLTDEQLKKITEQMKKMSDDNK